MSIIKRPSAILILSLLFIVGITLSAPDSFAARAYYGDDESDYEVQRQVEKDTSWFDYEHPKEKYFISTEAQLIGLASLVNENQVDKWKPTRIETFEGVTFVLAHDIRLTQDWTPIGSGDASHFAGTFDGNGHTISNLSVRVDSGLAGMFGLLTGQVKDLTINGKITSGDERCGAVAAQLASSGSVVNCVTDVTVSGKNKIGGVVGYNEEGTIESCTNKGNISGEYKVGGIVGENWGGTVTMCRNNGEITSSKRGVATYGTGGIAGRSVSAGAVVSQSCNFGNILSDTEGTGGVVGYVNAETSTVNDCYNRGDIKIANKKLNPKISKSYAGGVVGIVGTTGARIKNCYSASVIDGADFTGGVIGLFINDDESEEETGDISNNYYVSGQYDDGIGHIYDERIKNTANTTFGVSESGLQNMSGSLTISYKNDTGIYGNDGYPVLVWQDPLSEDERTYIPGVSRDVQIMFDDFMLEKAEKVRHGKAILTFFTPSEFSNEAILIYKDAKEKEAENNEK